MGYRHPALGREGCAPLGRLLREQVLWKGVGGSQGVAKRDQMEDEGMLVGLGTKVNRLPLPETGNAYFGCESDARNWRALCREPWAAWGLAFPRRADVLLVLGVLATSQVAGVTCLFPLRVSLPLLQVHSRLLPSVKGVSFP